MGITPSGSHMTSAEVDWLSCRLQKKPFMSDQINMHSCREINMHSRKPIQPIDFYKKDNMKDDEFLDSVRKKLKEVRLSNGNQ